jgi:hypothetical protein
VGQIDRVLKKPDLEENPQKDLRSLDSNMAVAAKINAYPRAAPQTKNL